MVPYIVSTTVPGSRRFPTTIVRAVNRTTVGAEEPHHEIMSNLFENQGFPIII